MPYAFTPPVQREIERVFAPEHRDYVRSKLAERELPMERSAPPPRVHIAAIWLSKGDLKRFDCELEGACCYWRDTLVSAGLAGAGWKHVLTQRGIECDDW